MATHSVFLPGESHGQRSLEGYSSWGHDGDLSLPLGLALGSPIFPSGCEGKLGVALEPPVTREPGRAPPRHAYGDLTSLALTTPQKSNWGLDGIRQMECRTRLPTTKPPAVPDGGGGASLQTNQKAGSSITE